MSAACLDTLVTALGWVGAVGGVTAYTMVTRGKWSPRGLRFQGVNLVSAALLCLVAGCKGVWPSVAANAVWIAVGIQAVIVVGRSRLRGRRPHEGAATAPGRTNVSVAG